MSFRRSPLLPAPALATPLAAALAVMAGSLCIAGSDAHAATRSRMDVRLTIADTCLVQHLPDSQPRVSCALDAAYRVVAPQPTPAAPTASADALVAPPTAGKSLVEIQF